MYKQFLIHTTQIGTSLSLGVLGAVLSVEDSLARLVKLQLGDDTVGRIHGDVHVLAVGLLPGASLDVDAVFLSVDSSHLALLAFELASGHGDLVLSNNRHRAHL